MTARDLERAVARELPSDSEVNATRLPGGDVELTVRRYVPSVGKWRQGKITVRRAAAEKMCGDLGALARAVAASVQRDGG